MQRLTRFILALWWGSLTSLGGWVVPLLFRHLPTKAEAGRMAAQLFSAQTWVSVVCGAVLLALAQRQAHDRRQVHGPAAAHPVEQNTVVALAGLQSLAIGLIATAMLAALLVEFAVAPHIVARDNLALWHGVGTALFGLQWVCCSALLWRWAR